MEILTCKLFKNIEEFHNYLYPGMDIPDNMRSDKYYHKIILKIANKFILENNAKPSADDLRKILNKWK